MRAAAAVLALTAALGWAADAPPVAVKSAGEIDWKASASLPPGAEYHLMYEDPKTHAVELLARMPNGYALPAHSHDADEVIYMIKGRLALGFGATAPSVPAGGILKPGSYAVLPAGTVFTMRAEGYGGALFVASFNGPFDFKPAAPAAPR